MAGPDGLPSDRLDRAPDGTWRPSRRTSPTDVAAYLWSTLGAEALGLLGRDAAGRRLGATLDSLDRLERRRGFFFNLYDVDTRRRPGADGQPGRPFLSTVDNGWLAAALVMVANARPTSATAPMPCSPRWTSASSTSRSTRPTPSRTPASSRGGYDPDTQKFGAFYGMLDTEPRIVSYLAIARGQVPPEHYYRLFRTFPEGRGKQHQAPRGEARTYRGVEVFEGHYEVDGRRVVPSWGGSMFEALMVPLFVPEGRWAPRSWGVNHPLHVRVQVEHAVAGAWGFSPCRVPEGGYATFGVPDLATEPLGYPTHEPGRPRAGVVTPHASFLALEFAPAEALANLRHLERAYPIFGEHGFLDSVNLATGAVSTSVLSLDQGMILAALANALADDAMQRAFTAGPVEATIRPLIAPEEFTAGDRP